MTGWPSAVGVWVTPLQVQANWLLTVHTSITTATFGRNTVGVLEPDSRSILDLYILAGCTIHVTFNHNYFKLITPPYLFFNLTIALDFGNPGWANCLKKENHDTFLTWLPTFSSSAWPQITTSERFPFSYLFSAQIETHSRLNIGPFNPGPITILSSPSLISPNSSILPGI